MKRIPVLCTLFISKFCYSQEFKPSLNLVQGKTYHQETSTKMKIKQTLDGNVAEVTTGVSGSVRFEVVDVNDSLYTLKCKYDTLGFSVEVEGNSQKFSSSENANAFSALLSKMTQYSFTISMYKTGRIKAVSGITQLIEDILNTLPNVPVEKKEAAKQQLIKAYGENAFKGGFESITNIFPDHPVKLNEPWQAFTKLESLMAASQQTQFVLRVANEQEYIIQGTSIDKTEDKEAYMPVNGMPVKYNLQGSTNSWFTVDRKTGWIKDAQISQYMEGSSTIKANAQLPNDTTIPMVLDTQMKVTGK